MSTAACPACKQRFSATAPCRMPASLSCGHVLCAECASAVATVVPPVCTVCNAGIAASSTPMPAFAELCDAKSPQPGVRDAANSGAGQDALLRAKAEQYRVAAAAASEACAAFDGIKFAFQRSADEAAETVVAAAAQLKAKVEEACAARVARIRRCCEDGLKQLQAQHDELLVRASQLGAAVAMCERAATGSHAELVLASLKSFDVLAHKPLHKAPPKITVCASDDFAKTVDDNAWMAVAYSPEGFQGILCRHLTIHSSRGNRGLAISPDGSQFAVSNDSCHDIAIYAVADGACIHTFGGRGAEPGKFHCPDKLVYHPVSGNLLVADCFNRRVQEVTPTGEAVRLIGAGVIGDDVAGIACSGALVAVGKIDTGNDNRVMLFDYASGAMVRSFGEWGDGAGQLGYCRGMRFTADGRSIVVANGSHSFGGYKLSQFTVEGVFVKEGARDLLEHCEDVEVTLNGDWIAFDFDSCEVLAFSGGDFSVVQRIRGAVSTSALAQSHAGETLVLAEDTSRVQVFM